MSSQRRSRWKQVVTRMSFFAAVLVAGYMLGRDRFLGPVFDWVTGQVKVDALLSFGGQASMLPETAESYRQTQRDAYLRRTLAVLIKSEFLLNAALHNPKVARLDEIQSREDPVAWLRKNIQAELLEGPELLRVTLSGRNEADLVVILNAILDAIESEIVQTEIAARSTRIRDLMELSKKYEARLRAVRRTYRDLNEVLGNGKEKAFKEQLVRDRIATFNGELSRVAIAEIAINARLVPLKAEDKSNLDANKTRRQLQMEGIELQEQKKMLDQELAALRTQLEETSPPRPLPLVLPQQPLAEPMVSMDIAGEIERTKDELETLERTARQLREAIETKSLELNAGSSIRVMLRAARREN